MKQNKILRAICKSLLSSYKLYFCESVSPITFFHLNQYLAFGQSDKIEYMKH